MTDIVDDGMSDNSGLSNIRERIAAALVAHARLDYIDPRKYSECRCKCGQPVHIAQPNDPDFAATVWAEHVADAVIRDVLTPEFLADLVIAAVQKAADDD